LLPCYAFFSPLIAAAATDIYFAAAIFDAAFSLFDCFSLLMLLMLFD